MVSRIDTSSEAKDSYIDYNSAMTTLLTALTLFTSLTSIPLAVLERIAEPAQEAKKYGRVLARARKGTLKGARGLATAVHEQRRRRMRGSFPSVRGGSLVDVAPADDGAASAGGAPRTEAALEAVLPGWARFEFELSDSEGDYSGEGSIHTNSDDDSDTIAAAHSVTELRSLNAAAAAYSSDRSAAGDAAGASEAYTEAYTEAENPQQRTARAKEQVIFDVDVMPLTPEQPTAPFDDAPSVPILEQGSSSFKRRESVAENMARVRGQGHMWV